MKRSLQIFQYGTNLHPNPMPEWELSPTNLIHISIENSPSSSSSIGSNSIINLWETGSNHLININSVKLQTCIERKVTSLIEEHGHQWIYGENYALLGQWLHGDSTNIPFLLDIQRNLLEYGINGAAFYDIMEIFVRYFS